MTDLNDTTGASSAQDGRLQTKIAIGAMLVPLFFVAAFSACIIGAYHKPHPNHIRLGVVGPPAQTAQLRAGLARATGSAFDIRSVPDPAQAVHAVRERDLNGAFIPGAAPGKPGTVVVASANGRIVAAAAESVARTVTTAQGAQLIVKEVRPLVPGDEIGLGIFMLLIVCTICAYIAPTIMDTVAPGLPRGRRYPILVVTAVLIPTIAWLIGGVGYGVFKGSFGTILAFVGVGALYTLTIGLGTRLFQVLVGPAAIFLSLAVLVFLNIASLGATYTAPVLSPFWHFLNRFWIGAGAVDAERGILYFDGDGVAGALLQVLAWTAAIVVLLLLASRRLERNRRRAAGHEAKPTLSAVA